MTTIKWLPKDAVLVFHARQLAEHGGGAGVRDEGLLESALQRPQNKAAYGEPDVAELAAAYAFGIARNHPFVDGNKRTSLVAARTFLLINGYQISAPGENRLNTWIALAAGELSEEQMTEWFLRWKVAR
jgi:death on curing protein